MFACQILLPIQPTEMDMETQLAENVYLALRNAGYAQLQNLKVQVDGRDVILQGRLPSYYLKQIAHHVVLAVTGVQRIVDKIDVVN